MAQEKTLLVVTSEPILRDIFKHQLDRLLNFKSILIAEDILKSYEIILKSNVDFLILDSHALDEHMFENLNKYKSLLSGVPIIGIVSKDLDRIKFLQKNRGFDDVLTKPFYLEDLVYSIRALFEKKRLEDDNSFTLGELCFYPDLKYFLNKSNNKQINLTEKETNILNLLIKFKGKTVLKEDLLKVVWGYNTIINTRTLETHIYRLRKKITKISSSLEVIRTMEGGYQIDI